MNALIRRALGRAQPSGVAQRAGEVRSALETEQAIPPDEPAGSPRRLQAEARIDEAFDQWREAQRAQRDGAEQEEPRIESATPAPAQSMDDWIRGERARRRGVTPQPSQPTEPPEPGLDGGARGGSVPAPPPSFDAVLRAEVEEGQIDRAERIAGRAEQIDRLRDDA